MGPQVSTNIQSQTQKTLNSITQSSKAVCATTCNQQQTGNVIFVNGSTTGNITFNQQCTVDASCQITNSIEAAATAVQKVLQSSSAQPSTFYFGLMSVSTNKQSSVQELSNIIAQAMDSTCNNGASQVQSANLIYVNNSTTGDIGFNQDTNLTSQCVLSNLSQATASATQQADQIASAGGLSGIVIAAIVVAIVVAIIIVVVVGHAGKKQKQSGGSTTTTQGQTSTAASGGGAQSAAAGAAKFVEANPEVLLA
jgi:hypothetical protein